MDIPHYSNHPTPKEETMYPEEFEKAYDKLVAKAWEDDAFKAEFLADPRKVFKDYGIDVPDGVNINIAEDTPDTVNFILPLGPADGELEDSELESVAGAFTMGCGYWPYCT